MRFTRTKAGFSSAGFYLMGICAPTIAAGADAMEWEWASYMGPWLVATGALSGLVGLTLTLMAAGLVPLPSAQQREAREALARRAADEWIDLGRDMVEFARAARVRSAEKFAREDFDHAEVLKDPFQGDVRALFEDRVRKAGSEMEELGVPNVERRLFGYFTNILTLENAAGFIGAGGRRLRDKIRSRDD